MATAKQLECSHTSEAIRIRLGRGARINYLRDWIYGAIDGGQITFAIVMLVPPFLGT